MADISISPESVGSNFGSDPLSVEALPDTAPIANNTPAIFDQRFASSRAAASPFIPRRCKA